MSRSPRRLFALTFGVWAYWWTLAAIVLLSAGEDAPGLLAPLFLASPVALIVQSRVFRGLRDHARSNRSLTPDTRSRWSGRLGLWVPFWGPIYAWRFLRATDRG